MRDGEQLTSYLKRLLHANVYRHGASTGDISHCMYTLGYKGPLMQSIRVSPAAPRSINHLEAGRPYTFHSDA